MDGRHTAWLAELYLVYETTYKSDYFEISMPILGEFGTSNYKFDHFPGQKIGAKVLELLDTTEEEYRSRYDEECLNIFISHHEIREQRCFPVLMDLLEADPSINLDAKIKEFKKQIDNLEFVKIEYKEPVKETAPINTDWLSLKEQIEAILDKEVDKIENQ